MTTNDIQGGGCDVNKSIGMVKVVVQAVILVVATVRGPLPFFSILWKSVAAAFFESPKKVNFTSSAFHPQHRIAIFHLKWMSASPPPRSISVDQHTGSYQNPGAGGHSDHPSECHYVWTSMGLRWSPRGGDGIIPLPL